MAKQRHSVLQRGRASDAVTPPVRDPSWLRVRAAPVHWLLALAAIGCGAQFGCGATSKTTQSSAAVEPVAANPAPTPQAAVRKPKAGRKNAQKRPRRPAVVGSTGVWWRAYAFFAPDSFDGYKARVATEGHDVSLGPGLGLVSLRRAYAKDGISLELELIDAARCPRMREVFLRSRELSRETDTVVIRPMKVQSHRAVTQWLASNNIARTSVLVADRFLVNVNVKPATAPNASIAMAAKLDFAGLEKLATVPAYPDDQLDAVDVVAAGDRAPSGVQVEPPMSASVATDAAEAAAGNAP